MTRPVVSATADRLYTSLGPMTQGDDALGWPLLRLCGVLLAAAADVESFAADTDTQVGWQPLLDPDLAPARALPFLGQMVGVQVPIGADEATARAVVKAKGGWGRGTPASIVATARLYLTGAQHVTLTERYGGDPYAVAVTVYSAECPDVPALTAAVRAALPAGLLLTVVVLAGWLVSEMESEESAETVAYLEANWATVGAFESQLP